MKVLLIGGTGTISSSVTRLLAATEQVDLTVMNRGKRSPDLPSNVRQLICDVNDEAAVTDAIGSEKFDVVADFIAFLPRQAARDIRVFSGRIGQYIFISSASAYQKPLSHFVITESTPLANPFWQYSRDKIACEELLIDAYRKEGFPVTIVRPSHTYADGAIPLALHGPKGPWTELKRMMDGRPVIVPGDGETLWTVTHSTDFAKGFLGLLSNPHAIGEAVHITSDESLSWNRIYQIVGESLGVRPVLCHVSTDMLVALDPELSGGLLGDKCHSVVFDNSKIKRLSPGFTAATRFDRGVRQSLEVLLQSPALQVFDSDWDRFVDRVIAKAERFKAD